MTPLTAEEKQLVEDNVDLARKVASMLVKRYPLDYDEILSNCFVSLIYAAQLYKSDKNTKFSTYARSRMEFDMRDAAYPRTKRVTQVYLEDIKVPSEDGLSLWEELFADHTDVEETVTHRLILQEVIKRVKQTPMSQKAKEILIAHFSNPDASNVEIAKAMNCSDTLVFLTYKDFRANLKDKLRKELVG